MDADAAARAEAMKYKLRKEAFVSNLSGSSLTDINIVTLSAASAILLWTALSRKGLLDDSAPVILVAIDFLLNVGAILFAFTVYASAPLFLNLALVVPSILLLLPLQQRTGKPSVKGKDELSKSKNQDTIIEHGTLITRPFLTNYRGAMLIATALAILAVDFHIFPRRFAKVETWGTSLMDLGVGSFVFSAGVVGARPVIRESRLQGQRKANVTQRLLVSLRHSLPLLVLGVARLISVKNLDYAEHVTEYGVHWNFFFTLALLPPFVETVDICFSLLRPTKPAQPKQHARSVRNDLAALLIAVVYETVLNNTNLLSFILISPRTPESSLLAKNREGVFSFFGYLAIFLSGRSTGVLVCQFQSVDVPHVKMKKGMSSVEMEEMKIKQERRQVILPQMALRAVVFAALYYLSTSVYIVNLSVSRRLANLPYVLWIITYNDAQLLLFAMIEDLGPTFVFTKSVSRSHGSALGVDEVVSPIIRAFNKNGLAMFLVANLGTGLVNLTVNTLDTGNVGAMGVLMTYAGALSVIAVGMDRMGFKLKL